MDEFNQWRLMICLSRVWWRYLYFLIGIRHWDCYSSCVYSSMSADICNGPFTRCSKLRVTHAPGMSETFSPPPTSKESLVSDPGMHHGTCVTHVPWCESGSLTRGDGENVPGLPGACATRNFVYLVRGPCWRTLCGLSLIFLHDGVISFTMTRYSVRFIGVFRRPTFIFGTWHIPKTILNLPNQRGYLVKELMNDTPQTSSSYNYKFRWEITLMCLLRLEYIISLSRDLYIKSLCVLKISF